MSERSRLLLCQLFALIFVALFFGQNLRAGFWFIDDHEILSALMKFRSGSSFWSVLMDSEVGHWGYGQRLRPAYYALRYLEVLLWGDQPVYWYLTRLLIFQQFLALSFFFAFRILSVFLAATFSLWLCSLLCWSDIVSRLGPGEAYLLLAGALALWAFFLSQKKYGKTAMAVAFVAAVIGAGSKENVAAYLLLLGLAGFWFLRPSKIAMLLSALVTLYSSAIVVGTYQGVRRLGLDVVGQSPGLVQRLSGLMSGLGRLEIQLSILTVMYLSFVYRDDLKKFRLPPILLAAIAMLGFVLLNSVFYSGGWPTNMRYDFPGIFCVGALVVMGLDFHARQAGSRQWVRRGLWGVFALFVISTSVDHLGRTLRASTENVERTMRTEAFMNELKAAVQQKTPSHLVYEVVNAMQDFEHYFSIQIFSRFYGIDTPIVPRMQVDMASPSLSPLDKTLLGRLAQETVEPSLIKSCISIVYRTVPEQTCEWMESVWK